MKAKVYVLTLTNLIFVGFLVNSGVSFWAVTPSLSISHDEYTKASNGCLCRRRQRRRPLTSLFFNRPVEQVDRQTGEVINTFPSAKEAAGTLGGEITASGISAAICGRSTSHGNFIWRRPDGYSRSIEQVDIETGEVLHVYPSIAEAARTTGYTKQSIQCIVAGKADRVSYKGFYWRRVGDKSSPKQPKPKAPIKQGRQPVEQICAQTGKVLATFDSIAEAAESLKISTRLIRMVLKGINKSTRGYTFRKVGEPVPFKRNLSARPVHQICLATGDILATHPSQAAAGRAVNVSIASIHVVATGKNAKSTGGYAWRLVQSVQQICLETGDVLATYPSNEAASKAANVRQKYIYNAATSKNCTSAGGYAWRYV